MRKQGHPSHSPAHPGRGGRWPFYLLSCWWIMLNGPDNAMLGGTKTGLSIPGALVLGGLNKAPTHCIFLQNDSDSRPASIWYVNKVSNNHYEMANATAPKGALYIGAFNWEIASGKSKGRLDSSAEWTTSDASVVKIISVSATAQATLSILKAGTATHTVRWGGLISKLIITAS